MKKVYLFILMLSLALFSCKKDVPKDVVSFKVDYAFKATSGEMLKSAATDYLAFYNKYIVGKILTPKSYHLEFTGKTKGNKATVDGTWSGSDIITLPADTYTIVGYSYPEGGNTLGDTCYINFNNEVAISKATTTISLTGTYACWLVAFNNSIGYLNYAWKVGETNYGDAIGFTEQFSYTFMKSAPAGGWFYNGNITVYNDTSWAVGNYYYYATIGAGYTIPAMIPM